MHEKVFVSSLGKTWILDLDGTIVKHNGYKQDGTDTLLPGAKEFFEKIKDGDMVIFITSRTQDVAAQTEKFLKENGIRYDAIFYGAPYGERILVNDKKPSGLATALAINTKRDCFMQVDFVVDEQL